MTDHELNKMLADVVGVEIQHMRDRVYRWRTPGGLWHRGKFDPVSVPDCMEAVKAGLRKQGLGYSVFWRSPFHHVTIYRPGTQGDPLGVGVEESELRAFALALSIMKKEKWNTT
jgi:hypothetical protein